MRFVLVFAVCVASAYAQAQDNFPAIRQPGRPDSVLRVHDEAEAINHLRSLGIVGTDGYVPRVWTRYEMAVSTHSAWVRLKSILGFLEGTSADGEELFKAIEGHEKELPVACLETVKLMDEFGTELTKLGADVDAMRSDARTLSKRFEAALLKRFLAKHALHPSPGWSIDIVPEVKKSGWLVGYPDSLDGPGLKNPYEMAVMSHALMSNLTRIVRDFQKLATQFSNGGPEVKSKGADLLEIGELKDARPVEGDLYRLVEEFYFELIHLGADPQEMISEIDDTFSRIADLRVPIFGESITPFLDIPDSHWAAKAANELKRAGILVGDGHGHFGG